MARPPFRPPIPPQSGVPSQGHREYLPYDPTPEVGEMAPGVPGSPPIYANVTSTFDARPINARDFVVVFDPCIDLLTDEWIAFGYKVPSGYVAILRDFSVQTMAKGFNPIGPSHSRLTDIYGYVSTNCNYGSGSSTYNDCFGSLLDVIILQQAFPGFLQDFEPQIASLSGNVPDYTNIEVNDAIVSHQNFESYILADEGAQIIIRIHNTDVSNGATWERASCYMHGNVLPKTGAPLETEPRTLYPLPVIQGYIDPYRR